MRRSIGNIRIIIPEATLNNAIHINEIMDNEEDKKAEEPEKVRKVSQVEGQPVRKVEIPADKYKVVSTK